jgi:hypothetical protein
MRKSTLAFSCLLVIAALSTPISAQTAPPQIAAMPPMKDGTAMMMMPNGKMETMPMSAEMKAMMKDAHPMAGNMIVMMDGGKMMTMEDKKMSDGKMMSEHMMMNKPK